MHDRPALLCFAHLRWAFVLQRPQHLLCRAARSYRVTYWEEPEWREGGVPELQLRITVDGVRVATPLLPWGTESDAAQRALLDRYRAEHDIVDPVLWVYSPHAMDWMGDLDGCPLVYDCMDELANFRFADPALPEKERSLIARADLVFTGGPSLFEAKRALRPDIHLFPSGVDAGHFHPARSRQRDPADQARIPRPRLGFYGVLDERLDPALLAAAAAARPDWQFVLVGPLAKLEPEDLPRAANLHLLGSKPYAELPAYLAGWDVALMPFALNEATRFISPTKTPEYLAAGCPVVSTAVPDVLRQYAGCAGVQVAPGTADGTDGFVAACERAMALPRQAWLPEADALLADRSWDAIWDWMAALIEARRPNAVATAA